ncbi:hypothetical protein KUTeg_008233 [Tegillarca granosa]|uniref:Sulfotransferase domain-containing protein n=1 Tax=Tegillarca granosa TaxID=220873 RepID=A0ABQ9F8J2_TEGGR|nr:hypothetical protein KUTeg_008233 [Tegillarca granosa]
MLTQGSADFAPMFTFIESLPMKQLEKSLSPRVICTHLPMRYLPPVILDKAKIVCVFRNPKDVAVSIHNFNSHLNFLDYNASFREYLQLFLSDGKESQVGDWKNWFTVAQNEEFDRIYEERMKDSKLKMKFSLD